MLLIFSVVFVQLLLQIANTDFWPSNTDIQIFSLKNTELNVATLVFNGYHFEYNLHQRRFLYSELAEQNGFAAI